MFITCSTDVHVFILHISALFKASSKTLNLVPLGGIPLSHTPNNEWFYQSYISLLCSVLIVGMRDYIPVCTSTKMLIQLFNVKHFFSYRSYSNFKVLYVVNVNHVQNCFLLFFFFYFFRYDICHNIWYLMRFGLKNVLLFINLFIYFYWRRLCFRKKDFFFYRLLVHPLKKKQIWLDKWLFL